MVRKRELTTGQDLLTQRSAQGPGWGCVGGKMFPWTLKNTNPSMGGNTRQVEFCLLETEPFTLSILSTPHGLWISTVNKT